MRLKKDLWLRARLNIVWVLFGCLDVLAGKPVRGAVFILVGVLTTWFLSVMQNRSTVRTEEGSLVVRNWPMQEMRFEVSDIAGVRPGRGPNAVVTEILVQHRGRVRRVSVWGSSSAGWERVREMVDSAKASRKTS